MELALQWLLSFAWIAGTVPILLALIPKFPGSRRLRHILSIFANRGKTVSSSVKRFLVPQSYFLHFYVVAVVWTTFLLACVWSHALGKEALLASVGHETQFTTMEEMVRVWRIAFMLLLMEIHVLRRFYESIFVFNYNKSAKMHIIGYLTGLYFYTAAPLSISGTVSAKACWHIGSLPEVVGKCPPRLSWWGCMKPLMKLGWWQWMGAAILFWGSVHQFQCHSILGSLRKQPGADKYYIVYGDWFELVSCPHYLAEIVIYAGILVSSGGSDLIIWLLFAFVVVNLVFAAAETHEWYRHKFDDYPSSRRAIFPLIF